jgi:ribosomal protein L15
VAFGLNQVQSRLIGGCAHCCGKSGTGMQSGTGMKSGTGMEGCGQRGEREGTNGTDKTRANFTQECGTFAAGRYSPLVSRHDP